MPLIENVVEPLAKGVLKPLELTAAVSAADVANHKNIFRVRISKTKSIRKKFRA